MFGTFMNTKTRTVMVNNGKMGFVTGTFKSTRKMRRWAHRVGLDPQVITPVEEREDSIDVTKFER